MLKQRSSAVVIVLLVSALAISVQPTSAQVRRPSAELAPVAQVRSVMPGETVAGELRVELSDGIHVQSDAPREEYLIPTRLTLTLPEGVTLEGMIYPPASDWYLQGQEEPLAVFESEFAIEWRVALAEDVSPGEMILPGSFQYQSCDDRLCYPPVTEDVQWRLRVERARNR